MDVSIVIPVCYESPSTITECIRSIRKTTGHCQTEVLLVNNNGKKNYESACPVSFDVVLRLERNEGYASACNRGAEHAIGNKLLLLNPDTVLEENFLPDLVRFLEAHPDTGIVGPRVRYPDGERSLTAMPDPSAWTFFCQMNRLSHTFPNSSLFAGYRQAYPWKTTDEPISVDWIGGMAVGMRRDEYLRIGGMDESYGLYMEDLDLCRRVRRDLDKKIMYNPQLKITHVTGAGSQNLGQFPAFNALRGHLLYAGRYFSLPARTFVYFSLLPRILIGLILTALPTTRSPDTRNHPYPGTVTNFLTLMAWTGPLVVIGSPPPKKNVAGEDP